MGEETDKQIIEHNVRRMTDPGKGSLQAALCTACLQEKISIYFDCDERGKIRDFCSSTDRFLPFVVVAGPSYRAIREHEYPEISGYNLTHVLTERAKSNLEKSIGRYEFRRKNIRIAREVR